MRARAKEGCADAHETVNSVGIRGGIHLVFQLLAERHLGCYRTRTVMPRFHLRRLLLALVVLAAAMGPSCAAPVLPLPPPTMLIEEPPDADGFATVVGMARASAFVSCLNETADPIFGVIVRANAAGAYVCRIQAQSCDVIATWQFESTGDGGQQSRQTVPLVSGGGATGCPSGAAADAGP